MDSVLTELTFEKCLFDLLDCGESEAIDALVNLIIHEAGTEDDWWLPTL